MTHWDTLDTQTHKGFTIKIDTAPEFIHPGDLFDDTCYDIAEMCSKIDRGILDWFMLRVRALVDDVELGSAYLGGCLYDDRREVLKDGTVEDLIDEAVFQAEERAKLLTKKLVDIVVQ